MKSLAILGSTGSIGTSTLDVVRHNKDKFRVEFLLANSNYQLMIEQCEEFQPKYIYLRSEEAKKSFLSNIGQLSNKTTLLSSDDEVEQVLGSEFIDTVVAAIVGFAGLKPVYHSLKNGKHVLLANKESIVAGGDLILPIAKEHNTEIMPIDSEHNAIFQCLNGEKGIEDVKEVIITASGGPFLNSSVEDLKNVTLQDALNHPNWKMGTKVTIDSATLVNKCLELIEAKYLFDLDENYFNLVIHPQSIIHSIVTYVDGSSICQMSNPDMKVPIAHALSEKNRLTIDFNSLDFTSLNLTFQEFPKDRMQIQNIAREVCNRGGNLGTVFNAANEVAVESFINGEIKFDEIYEVIYRTFSIDHMSKDLSIESIHDIDTQTRIEAKKVVKSFN